MWGGGGGVVVVLVLSLCATFKLLLIHKNSSHDHSGHR